MNTILTLQDVASARAYYESGYWQTDTLYMLVRSWAAKSPDSFALRDVGARLTYRETIAWVDAVAQDLHAAGLRPGDRVSIWSPSRIETALVFLACSRMGYACNTSLHRDYTCKDIVDLLERAGAAAFFVQPGYGADGDKNDILAMLGGLSNLKNTYLLDPLQPRPADEPPATRFGGLKPVSSCAAPMSTNPDRIVYLAYTSGTTGRPKGVMHSDNTILANSRATVEDWKFDQTTIVYPFSPLSHNIGIVGLGIAFAAGAELVVHTPFDQTRMYDRVVETGATFLLGVPTHGIDLLAEVERHGATSLGRVAAFSLGGSAVPASLVERLITLGVVTQNAYGMTENHSFLLSRPDDDIEVTATTCGKPMAGMEVVIVRETDWNVPVADGEVGELGVRGPSMMLGYFGDQTSTETSFNRDGWFMTGDLARYDAHKNVQIVGRKKDLIIRGGHNIYPARIEDMIARSPMVAKAAAFPVADERLGERVCLAVIAREGAKADPVQLLALLHDNGLSKYDMPEFFLEVERFPLTPSGKILKRALVEMVAKGELSPQPIRWRG